MATVASGKKKPADAKLFWNGRSQAVRLPKEFRFEGDRVRVSRMGAGVLLEPMPETGKKRSRSGLRGSMRWEPTRSFLRGESRILRRFVSISSELPARYERLHRSDQWDVQPGPRALQTGGAQPCGPYNLADRCS